MSFDWGRTRWSALRHQQLPVSFVSCYVFVHLALCEGPEGVSGTARKGLKTHTTITVTNQGEKEEIPRESTA